MDFLFYLLNRMWSWVANTGFAAAALITLLLLVPRIRRYVISVVSRRLHGNQEDKKGQKALIGAIVYVVELVAYFVIILNLLETLGISIGAAVVPATIVSAALGFGAQDLVKDLLGGVFIIIEKQYGVGDWVEFHSPSGTVQGEVVNLTLRASTIRTLNGEEVIIPNGDAKMSVNYSSRWSRAVIDIPVPLTSGGSMSELERRTLAAAEAAVDKEDVRASLRSDLSIQSSTSLNPPTATGQSWTVNLRMIIDTDPGDQWKVERAVRSAIIDTWWDDYGERVPTALMPSPDQLEAYTRIADTEEKKHEESEARYDDKPPARSATTAHAWSSHPDRVTGDRLPSEEEVDAKRADDPAGDGRNRAANLAAAADAYSSDGALDVESVDTAEGPAADEATTTHRLVTDETVALHRADEDDASENADGDEPKHLPPKAKLREILSAGGRARPSTVVLIILFLLFSALNVMSIEPEEGSDNPSGWLAPSRFNQPNTTTSAPETEVENNAPQGTTATTNPQDTNNPVPEQRNLPGDSGGQNNQPQPSIPEQSPVPDSLPEQEGNAAPAQGAEPQEDSL